jgi:hypothetical protein
VEAVAKQIDCLALWHSEECLNFYFLIVLQTARARREQSGDAHSKRNEFKASIFSSFEAFSRTFTIGDAPWRMI